MELLTNPGHFIGIKHLLFIEEGKVQATIKDNPCTMRAL